MKPMGPVPPARNHEDMKDLLSQADYREKAKSEWALMSLPVLLLLLVAAIAAIVLGFTFG